MSEVKTYQCMIPSNEPYRHLQATVVVYSDYASLESKASRLREALAELRSCSRAKIGMEDDFAYAVVQMRDAIAA